MAVTSTTLAGVNVWQLSGAVTDAELKTAWAALIINNRYKIGRYLYVDSTCSLVNVRGTYYIDCEALGIILHSSRNKANTVFNNFVLTQTTGLAVGARANFVRVTNGTTITNTVDDGISMKGGAMLYAVVGNPGGGDPRYLNEMQFGSLDGTVVTSAAYTEQELEPCSTGTIWKGLNLQKVAGYPILQLSTGFQRQVVYRCALNTEGTQKIVRPYYNNSVCYVSSTARRNGVAVTSNLYDTFGSTGSAVIMVLNNYTDETWFGAAKTAIAGSNWSTNNRFIGGVMKRLQVQPSTVIRSYDSRSTAYAQKNTFSETTRDFLTGTGVQNFHLYSEQLDNAYWTKNGTTILANAATAPDGTMTADKVREDATTGQHRVNSGTVAVTSGVAYAYSIYAEPAERSFLHMRLISTSTNAQACFNLTNGTFIASAGTTASITLDKEGFYRCSVSGVTDGAGAIGYANMATSSSLTVPSYAGTSGSGMFLWGGQIRIGTDAGDYTPTTALPAESGFSTTADPSTGNAQIVAVGAIATGGSCSITRFTGQKFTLQKFGYQVQVVVPDMSFGDDDLSAYAPITMTVQSGITRTESAINSATVLTSFQDLLEELHVIAIGLVGSNSYNAYNGGNLFNFAGDVLTTNFTSVAVDATAPSKIVYDAAANALTIKATTLAGNETVAKWVNASGSVTLSNGAAITGLYQSSTGPSSRLTFSGLDSSSTYVEDNAGSSYDYQSNKTGTLVDYFSPGKTGTWRWVATREGYKFQAGTFTPGSGGDFAASPVWVADTGLVITDPAILAAYTNLSDPNMMLDYDAFWGTLAAGIPYRGKITKNGTATDFGNADVYFSNTATVPLAYNPTTNKFTVKAVTVNQGSSLFSVRTTGTISTEAGTTLNIAYQDASGLRANIFNLDPEGFGVTWYLRYMKNSGGTWTNVSGTGNTATVLMDVALYDVQVRAPGYDWKSLQIDTAKTQILDAALAYQVSANNTPQYTMSYDTALANAFQYDATAMKVSVANTTGAITAPGFAELYQATQRIQHLPALVWTWSAPVTANSSTQKILIPPSNPISMYLTAASNSSVKLTCPVIYSDTGASADDRVLGNASGYSIILGSPATAESAGLRSEIVSDIIAKIGGTGFVVDTHSLVEVKDFAEKAYKNAKQAKLNTF